MTPAKLILFRSTSLSGFGDGRDSYDKNVDNFIWYKEINVIHLYSKLKKWKVHQEW
jgi:hypothetical protein